MIRIMMTREIIGYLAPESGAELALDWVYDEIASVGIIAAIRTRGQLLIRRRQRQYP